MEQVEEEEAEEEEDDIQQCSSPREEVRNVRKIYIRADKEPILAWLGRCYDTGAPALVVADKSAAQLGTFPKDNGIDRHLGRTLGKVTLWICLLMATLMRYPSQDDLPWNPKPWTTIDEGIKGLREFAVREVLYGGHATLNPDEIPVGTGLAKKLIKLAPPNYANILASRIVARNYGGASPTVGQFTDQMRQLEVSMIHVSLVSAIETLSGKIENCMKELKDEFKNTIS